jgi:hypothetical protein
VITTWAGMPSVVENADRMEKVGRMLREIERTLQSPKAGQAALRSCEGASALRQDTHPLLAKNAGPDRVGGSDAHERSQDCCLEERDRVYPLRRCTVLETRERLQP